MSGLAFGNYHRRRMNAARAKERKKVAQKAQQTRNDRKPRKPRKKTKNRKGKGPFLTQKNLNAISEAHKQGLYREMVRDVADNFGRRLAQPESGNLPYKKKMVQWSDLEDFCREHNLEFSHVLNEIYNRGWLSDSCWHPGNTLYCILPYNIDPLFDQEGPPAFSRGATTEAFLNDPAMLAIRRFPWCPGAACSTCSRLVKANPTTKDVPNAKITLNTTCSTFDTRFT